MIRYVEKFSHDFVRYVWMFNHIFNFNFQYSNMANNLLRTETISVFSIFHIITFILLQQNQKNGTGDNRDSN